MVDREEVVFQCRDAFLPLVNPLVSLVRIRSEKSLICLQNPKGFIGEEIFTAFIWIWIYFGIYLFLFIAAHVWFLLSYPVTVFLINVAFFCLLLQVLHSNLEILESNPPFFDWLSI